MRWQVSALLVLWPWWGTQPLRKTSAREGGKNGKPIPHQMGPQKKIIALYTTFEICRMTVVVVLLALLIASVVLWSYIHSCSTYLDLRSEEPGAPKCWFFSDEERRDEWQNCNGDEWRIYVCNIILVARGREPKRRYEITHETACALCSWDFSHGIISTFMFYCNQISI